MALKDITGMRYGRLLVLGRGEDYIQPSGRHRTRWLCQCDCGRVLYILGDNLRGGKSNSCGCLRNEGLSDRQKTHGESKTKLYRVWSAMKRRCYNKHSAYYCDYGGRGIRVCNEWKDSYESFRDWALYNGYGEGLTIDRVNVDGDYSPLNCRWVNHTVQANNRRNNKLFTYNGETHNIAEWAELFHIPYKKLHRRLSSGWDITRALTK